MSSFQKLLPPTFQWNETINDFAQQVSATYDVVVHWRRSVFLVPYGCAGKEFVQELARLFCSYGEAGALESIAIKAVCNLLQPHPKTTNREIVTCLKLRLSLWT